MSSTETMKEVYLLAQEHCGLKVGDCVKITRKAENYEAGWSFEWLRDANKTIGIVGKICDICSVGIKVSFTDPNLANCWYPYFVLEKVEKLVPEFKPFDRVLVRDDICDTWRTNIFSHKSGKHFPFVAAGGEWKYCIPYEGNEHLVGTTGSPEE